MPLRAIHQCQCPECQQDAASPVQALHRQMNLLLSGLDEQQRQWYVALESNRMGEGGDALLSLITGLDEKTICKGRQELALEMAERPTERVRLPGGGLGWKKKAPEIVGVLEGMMDPETAGSPTSEAKWVRSSLGHLSQRLGEAGYRVSPPTVRRLLRQRHYSLKKNRKTQEAGATHPDRNRQFESLQQQRAVFEDAGWPIISVDAKKKELIGAFANAGRRWCQDAIPVKVHDFRSCAQGQAVP